MGRSRQPLPEVPLCMLSPQQRAVYKLSANHGTREIAEMLSIPEKQVRQVYSAIRSKSREFANKNVSPAAGAEPVHYGLRADLKNPFHYDFIKELMENNGLPNFTASERIVMEQVKRGMSVKEISKLTGKSVQSVRKTRRRAKTKLCQNNGFFDDNCITKIDTGKTYVTINCSLIRSAMDKTNLTRDEICRKTGIPPGRMTEIESSGKVSYDELFKLARHLDVNPYGPSEKEKLLKKLSDTNWIKALRSGPAESGGRNDFIHPRERIGRNKARYRNRVMYYGTARVRHDGCSRERPVVEDGRNGLFPLSLTRRQQAECRWLLKKLMIRPAYTYRYPGLLPEIRRLERMLEAEKDRSRADRYMREIVFLKENIVPEDGRSIFIVNRSHFLAINRILFEQ
ncbi:MAG: hypothetical protein K6T66_12940 [Peptococcaceae bacterium]|nr:hypothetical protein [Peptococcaceae bacterium]